MIYLHDLPSLNKTNKKQKNFINKMWTQDVVQYIEQVFLNYTLYKKNIIYLNCAIRYKHQLVLQ